MGLFGAKDSWRYFIGGELESRPSHLPLLAALASRSTTVRRSFVAKTWCYSASWRRRVNSGP